jgi:GNAT superfamily N-acetyltransferase
MNDQRIIPVHLFVNLPAESLKAMTVVDLMEISRDVAVEWAGDSFEFSIRFRGDADHMERSLRDFAASPQAGFAIVISDALVGEAADGKPRATPLAAGLRKLFRYSASYCGLIGVGRRAERRVSDIDWVVGGSPVDCRALMDCVALVARRLWLKAPPPATSGGKADGGGAAAFDVRPVTSLGEFRDCLRLRHKVYDLLGYLPEDVSAAASAIDMDFYDPQSLHFVAVDSSTRAILGTARLILPGSGGLLAIEDLYTLDRFDDWCERLASEEVSPVFRQSLAQGPTAALPLYNAFIRERLREKAVMQKCSELSRFVVAPEHRGRRVSRKLFDAVVQGALLHRRRHLLLECAPHHQRLYEKMGFKVCRTDDGQEFYERAQLLDQVAVAMKFDLKSILQRAGHATSPGDSGVFPAINDAADGQAAVRPFEMKRDPSTAASPPAANLKEMTEMQSITLSFVAPGLDDQSLKALAQQARNTLSDTGDIEADFEETPGVAGHKGAVLSIGSLILRLFKTGAAGTLMGALRPLFDHTQDLKLVLKRADGETLEIDAKRLRGEQVKTLNDSVRAFIGEDAAPARA